MLIDFDEPLTSSSYHQVLMIISHVHCSPSCENTRIVHIDGIISGEVAAIEFVDIDIRAGNHKAEKHVIAGNAYRCDVTLKALVDSFLVDERTFVEGVDIDLSVLGENKELVVITDGSGAIPVLIDLNC